MEVDALLAAPWAGLRCFHEQSRYCFEATIVYIAPYDRSPASWGYVGGYVRGLCPRAMFAPLRGYVCGATIAAHPFPLFAGGYVRSPTNIAPLRTQPLNIAKKVLCLWGYDRNGFLAV